MLQIEVPPGEFFDESDSTFKTGDSIVLSLEHSLMSVSKWESKWCVPFLSKNDKTPNEILDYIKCMTLTKNVDDDVYKQLSEDNIKAIQNYINAPMTATVISKTNQKQSREIVTAEIIYYWMVAFQIPFECQKWHLNKLLMLINVCSIKQQDPKKMKGKALAKSNSALNAQRKLLSNTQG